jgi:hypothetical protein
MVKEDRRFPKPILPFDVWGPVPANQDPRDDEYELDERYKQSTINKNRLESERARLEIEKTQLEIERLKREKQLEEERWRNSPEGKEYIRKMNKRYDDKRFYVRDKSINFLFTRPLDLLRNRKAGNVTYKNYISVIYWLFFVGIYSYIYGILGFFGGILIAMILVGIFYFVRFELGLL